MKKWLSFLVIALLPLSYTVWIVYSSANDVVPADYAVIYSYLLAYIFFGVICFIVISILPEKIRMKINFGWIFSIVYHVIFVALFAYFSPLLIWWVSGGAEGWPLW